jgi:hypothetical protein
MSLITHIRTRRQQKIDREIERIRGWAAAPARTLRQIRADIEPWGHKVKDTLPVPRWDLSWSEKIWATGLWVELMKRKLLR